MVNSWWNNHTTHFLHVIAEWHCTPIPACFWLNILKVWCTNPKIVQTMPQYSHTVLYHHCHICINFLRSSVGKLVKSLCPKSYLDAIMPKYSLDLMKMNFDLQRWSACSFAYIYWMAVFSAFYTNWRPVTVQLVFIFHDI